MASIAKSEERTFVVALRKQLLTAKLAVNDASINHQSDLDLKGQFDQIEKDLKTIREAFSRSAKCERTVRDDLESSTREANDISDRCPDFLNNLQLINENLKKIGENIESAKEKVEKSFPELSDSDPCSSRSKDGTGKEIGLKKQVNDSKSKEWEKHESKLEEEILKSPAMSHLKVSYDHLEAQLKLCLLCLSVFPDSYEIKKRVLIYWWIGEGLVAPKGEKSAEDVGEECFNKLLDLGLIQPIPAKASKIVHRCKVHPWIRRMLILPPKNAQFFDLDDQGKAMTEFIKSRRACLVKGKSSEVNETAQSDLLSLINIDENVIRLKREWLSELRKAVVLQLGRSHTNAEHHIELEDTTLLNGLGSLQHLRYLSLRGISRITELPDSIRQLDNLRILDLRACHNLEKLPSGITSLKRLTHFDATECYFLDHMPRGMGSMSELQVLKGFVWGGGSRSSKLSDLTKLEKLRKLSISIGKDTPISAEEFAKIKSLRSLTIVWSGEVGKSTIKSNTAPTAAVPGVNITVQKLDLRCFPKESLHIRGGGLNSLAVNTPVWLGVFSNLKSLYIRGGKLSDLKLEALSKLEILRLKFLSKLGCDWTQWTRDLKELRSVEIQDCPGLGEDRIWHRVIQR